MKLGFFGLLFIILLALKLTGVINISWLWVIAPLIVGPLFILFIAILGLLLWRK